MVAIAHPPSKTLSFHDRWTFPPSLSFLSLGRTFEFAPQHKPHKKTLRDGCPQATAIGHGGGALAHAAGCPQGATAGRRAPRAHGAFGGRRAARCGHGVARGGARCRGCETSGGVLRSCIAAGSYWWCCWHQGFGPDGDAATATRVRSARATLSVASVGGGSAGPRASRRDALRDPAPEGGNAVAGRADRGDDPQCGEHGAAGARV